MALTLIEFLFLHASLCMVSQSTLASGQQMDMGSKLPQLSPTPSSSPMPECYSQQTCVPLKNPSCLGQPLPYNSSYFGFATDSNTEEEVHQKLLLWSGLQNVPKCWEVIQQLLCATYLPRCVNGTVEQPARELCEVTREPCKIVTSVQPWPYFLQCNQSHFIKGCKNQVKTVKFNTTGRCMAPLVPTSNRNSWYKDVEGCGVQCQNPLFTDEEHRLVRIFIAVFSALCLVATLFAILTFLVDWKNANRYPALILFFINVCFFIGSIGWVIQFIPGARQDIVCRHDGTVRQAEPQIGSGETASCSVVFVLVYYSMMAGSTWFLILSYTWHLTFQALGSAADAIEGKKGTFHLIAWSIPLVLTIVCLALTQVDGDSVSGICFVGYLHHEYRGGFVLFPISIVVAGGLFFLTRGLITLIKIKLETPGLISDRASAKIRDSIIRIGVFAGLAFLITAVTCLVHVYVFVNEPKWHKAFQDFVICETNHTVSRLVSNQTLADCVLEARPSLIATIVHILLFFTAGITMSSWVWTASTKEAWKRFYRRLCRLPTNEPVKLKKHLVIRQAFNKRHDIHRHGRFEFSFHSTHDDPLGMKMDLNSMTSQDLSSTWAQAIPRMISRRGAFAHPPKADKTGRRYSDSDVQSIQATVHRTSVESRRYSVESEQFQQPQTTTTEVEDLRNKKQQKRRRGKNRVAPLVTTTPPVSQSHNKPTSGYFVRRNNRIGVINNNNNSNGSGGNQNMVQSINLHSRRGSVTGSEGSDNNVHTLSLENVDSSDTGSLPRANSSKRGSLASVELPAITVQSPPQYHVNTVQHQYAFYSASAYTGGGLPGAVQGPFEMNGLEVDPEPTFTSVTPIDTELQSTPVFKRRGGVLGRRSSVSSIRSASSGHSHSRSNSRNRASHRDHSGHAIAKKFVVHTSRNAMNVRHGGDRESYDMPEISGCD